MPMSNRAFAIVRGSLAAVVAVCLMPIALHFFQTGTAVSDAAIIRSPYLLNTPASPEGDDTMRAGDQPDRVTGPYWAGVHGSVRYTEVRPQGARTGVVSGAWSPWMVRRTGAVGQPLSFEVQALASAHPARSEDRTPVGKLRNWELQRATNLAPAAQVRAHVFSNQRSPIQTSEHPGGVLRVTVPAVDGDAQVAWVYPTQAVRASDGSWTVMVAVGAAPSQEITAYQHDQNAGSWRLMAGMLLTGLSLSLLLVARCSWKRWTQGDAGGRSTPPGNGQMDNRRLFTGKA